MCGFAGMAASEADAAPTAALLARMAGTLQHRGPDDGTELARGPLGIGFRRLSIIDVDGGRQPIENETGDIAVVCNGEIYNFLELRAELEAKGHRFRTQSDVEVIVHLYEEVGAACITRLHGMFALAVLDWREPGRERLLLARDRIGIKPLYFARTGRGLLFGSEPKALLASGLLPRRLRGEALLEYLVAGYTSGPRAAWEGMERLPPGSTLAWTRGAEPVVARYWDLPSDALREPAPDEEILELLDRVVRDHLVSDVPLGAFLSGGVDSSAVLDSMARARAARPDRTTRSVAERLLACTVGFEDQAFDEVETAKATAARVQAEHHTAILEADPRLALDVLPWLFDEPLADPSTVPTLVVSQMARRFVTVALSGDGGDEVFAGYRRYVFDVAEHRARAVLGRTGSRILGEVGRRYPKLDWAPRVLRAKSTLENLGTDPARAYWHSVTQLGRDDVLALLEPGLARSLASYDPFDAFEDHYKRPRIEDPLFRAQYADFHHFLPDRILVKADRASMGASLEVRPPLLDHRFVERFVTLPPDEKVRGGRGKHAFRRALGARLPASLLGATKRGFDIPLTAWTRGPLAQAIAEAIEGLPERWFDRKTLRARQAEHASGLTDHSHLLWSLLVLERWRLRHGVDEVVA
ncbi:MAG TPA: asparagine synthase (glutamine-hydrolyzing) [Planctomycetota bacterium]|jgi:asparagine synthase (glutamine-hydrolysing)|nr:asparagine synthase (glutamine-hydrolyzing) [Planctomycetota bacterium]